MAEPRKVPFVTISTFNTSPATPESSKKRRREDEAIDITFGKDGDGGGGAAAVGSGGGGGSGGSGPFGNVNAAGGDAEAGEAKPTVRLHLPLSEPSDRGSSEFNYGELVNTSLTQVKLAGSTVPKGLAPPLDPSDPFADADRERREVEAMAKKFESKYSVVPKKKKKDRMQDLIDIGYGYDDTDPFIDNSEAYDELVPASLTTKHGGFYINTGTLQFRAASESEGENAGAEDNRFKKTKDGEERVIKKRRKKQEGGILEEKKPRKNKVPKAGVSALNVHRPEKKKRKKLMKDSIHLANMLRRFTREKEEMRKRNVTPVGLARPAAAAAAAAAKVPNATSALHNAQSKAAGGNECNMADLAADQAVLSMLGSTNNDILQDMMGDLDFEMLDSPQPSSPLQGENGSFHKAGGSRLLPGNVMAPPPLPGGLPAPLAKRIEDLRSASRLFDAEGRKKFFTLDMNNILLDIELQVQEQPTEVRAVVYSHLEAFVPCNKEALLKRLKKLSLNIQDDRLRTPLLKLKLAVCSVMPEQIARYNMDCIAKVAKQQSGEGEKNGSEDDDEEKPGKRVMGPRKKFVWDDKLRLLLCNLVRVKLGCYELEGKNSLSLEDYLKAFMETEVKLLWPKGWMQARMLFKESIMAHGHLTGYTAKKRMVTTPKAKPKEAMWVQRPVASAGATPSPAGQAAKRPPQSPSEPICLDSLDEDLTAPSLDSISQALAILGNAAKGLAHGDPPSPDGPKAAAKPSSLHVLPLMQQQQQQQQQQQKKNSVSAASSNAPHYISTSSSISTPLSRPLSVTPPSRPLSVTSTPPSRPLSVTSSSTPLSRPLSVTSSPLSRPLSVTSPSLSRPLSVTSPSLSRPLSVTSPSLSRTLSVTSTPLSRTLSVTSTPLSRPLSVTSASLSRPLSVTSTSLSRPLSVTSAPLPSMRPDGMGVIKGASQAHRHSMLNTQRALVVGVAKANMLASAPPPKPRPPPTASPLVAPGSKAAAPGSKAGGPTSGLHKGSNNKANSGDTLIITSPPPRPHTLITSPHMLAKTFQMPRLPHNPPSKSSPSLTQTLPGVQPRPQSNFITPMHATLTKSAHSSIPPIVKLTPRTLNHAATTTTTSPSVSISPRSQANPPMHQYSPKGAAGFRSAFSGAQGGATKQGQGSYTPPGSQKTPNNNNNNSSTTNASLINTISISKHSGSSASPTIASANQGQRQRPGGGTPQGAKPVASVPASSVSSQLPQVSTAGGGGSLLGSASSLPLGFGMLGGLVPVSLPFQFPQLLNLPPLGTTGSSSAAGGSVASSNASFSTLTQNVSQSQGGDAKRKTL